MNRLGAIRWAEVLADVMRRENECLEKERERGELENVWVQF